MSQMEDPKVIVHEPCGNDIFLYFGLEEDAKILRKIDNIATMDGCSLTVDDILNCPHCGLAIRIPQLKIGNPGQSYISNMGSKEAEDQKNKYIIENSWKLLKREYK